jgi:ActR/RegA family two-component response regulator
MSLDREAKIVVVSSASSIGNKVMEAINLGAKNSITKPLDPVKVIEILSAL